MGARRRRQLGEDLHLRHRIFLFGGSADGADRENMRKLQDRENTWLHAAFIDRRINWLREMMFAANRKAPRRSRLALFNTAFWVTLAGTQSDKAVAEQLR